jgi:hypothetical protein
METTGEPTTILRMEFVRVAPDQVTIRRTVATESGEILNGPTDLTSTWTELRSHALWPAKDMSITEDTVEVPAGRFDALLYDVRELSEEGPMRTKAWFAKSLPGAPVLMKVDVEGGPSSTMTLVEHVAGE